MRASVRTKLNSGLRQSVDVGPRKKSLVIGRLPLAVRIWPYRQRCEAGNNEICRRHTHALQLWRRHGEKISHAVFEGQHDRMVGKFAMLARSLEKLIERDYVMKAT